jgi:hypothetical protein
VRREKVGVRIPGYVGLALLPPEFPETERQGDMRGNRYGKPVSWLTRQA